MKAVLCVIAAVITVTALVGLRAQIASAEPVIAFEMNDPKGDDYGRHIYLPYTQSVHTRLV